ADLPARQRREPPFLLLDAAVREQQLLVADVRCVAVEQVMANRRLAEHGAHLGELREGESEPAVLARKVRSPEVLPLDLGAQLRQLRQEVAEGLGKEIALEGESV